MKYLTSLLGAMTPQTQTGFHSMCEFPDELIPDFTLTLSQPCQSCCHTVGRCSLQRGYVNNNVWTHCECQSTEGNDITMAVIARCDTR